MTSPTSLLLADTGAYMRTFRTLSMTGDTAPMRDGTAVASYLQQSLGFAYGPRRTEVQLTAPLVRIYLEVAGLAPNLEIFPFSRSTVHAKVGPDDGTGNGVRAYLIPYKAGSSRGVKLPSQAEDGLPDVFAFTAAQDGCTFDIMGSRASPYCSHTNCIDKAGAERMAKMQERIDRLHQRFQAAETAAAPGYKAPTSYDTQRTQFQHYSDGRAAPPGGGIQEVNYTQAKAAAAVRLDGKSFKAARDNTGPFSHKRYHITLTKASRDELLNPAAVGAGQVIGRRCHGVWTFYFQEHATLYFEVVEVHKVGPKLERNRTVIPSVYGKAADVVLCSGELWPVHSPQIFDPDDFN